MSKNKVRRSDRGHTNEPDFEVRLCVARAALDDVVIVGSAEKYMVSDTTIQIIISILCAADGSVFCSPH